MIGKRKRRKPWSVSAARFLRKAKFCRSPKFRALSNWKLRNKRTSQNHLFRSINLLKRSQRILPLPMQQRSQTLLPQHRIPKSVAGVADAVVDAIVAKAQKSQPKFQGRALYPKSL